MIVMMMLVLLEMVMLMMTTLKPARWPEQSPRIKLGVSSSSRNPTIKTLVTRTLTLIGICWTNPTSVLRELQPIWWGRCTQVITSKRDCQGWLRSEARAYHRAITWLAGGTLHPLQNASRYQMHPTIRTVQCCMNSSTDITLLQNTNMCRNHHFTHWEGLLCDVCPKFCGSY